jgi:hypothetical protein
VSAQTIFEQVRPSQWPAPEGTTVTVTARLDRDAIGIHWKRSDLPIPAHVALYLNEFDAIARALGYTK